VRASAREKTWGATQPQQRHYHHRVARRGRIAKPAAPLPRRAPQTATGTDIVDLLLVAAERVLAEHGLAGLTTNRCAKVAGVSVGSLYQYFPNKEAIVRALHERYSKQYVAVLPRVIGESAGQPFSVLAQRIADGYLDVIHSQAPIHRVLWELRSAADIHALIDQTLSTLIDVATLGIQQFGVASGEKARAIAFVMVHGVDGVGNAIAQRGPDFDARLIARSFVEMVTAYVDSLQNATRK